MTLYEIYTNILGGGGILAIALCLIQVVPIKLNPLDGLCKRLAKTINAEVLEKMEEEQANNCRYRILRFDDEIRHNEWHTEEHFNQILDDITTYERYCLDHPSYPNCKAVSAISNIKEIYEKCRKENIFLV